MERLWFNLVHSFCLIPHIYENMQHKDSRAGHPKRLQGVPAPRSDLVFWAARGKRLRALPYVHKYWDVSARPGWMTFGTMRRFLGLRHKRRPSAGNVSAGDAFWASECRDDQFWASERLKKEFWASRGKKENRNGSDFWASRGKKSGASSDFWASRGRRAGAYLAYDTDKRSTLQLLKIKRDPFWASRG
ncbi:uncharacterized protein LOC119098181 [Pollicipes pollicipes]|uniref:uncharacterized protein LOC119098181 n=1 Tax=Pollicipes pollicipes TaxID=41117 RepID=UPI00188507F8|nr:uncharacterized protein LOC119098181 [Pollicipes pollicipes]